MASGRDEEVIKDLLKVKQRGEKMEAGLIWPAPDFDCLGTCTGMEKFWVRGRASPVLPRTGIEVRDVRAS